MGVAVRIPMSMIGICQPVAGVLGIIGTIQSLLEYREKVEIPDTAQEAQGIGKE
jgi:hypothetical protein